METVFVLFVLLNVVYSNDPIIFFTGASTGYFEPCDNRAVLMVREGSRPPSVSNYWDGFIDLKKLGGVHVNITEPMIELQLTAPASVIVDEEDGYVTYSTDKFYVKYYQKSREELMFTVQGKRGRPFPNLIKLKLNYEDICPNPAQWEWKLGGLSSNADSDDKSHLGPDDCGRQLIKHRTLIMNGFPSEEGEWPWHAGIYFRTSSNRIEYECGGTLISNSTVLTAAHCASISGRAILPDKVLVRLGQHERLRTGPNTQEFQVHQIILHEQFELYDLKHDVALLRLESQATFNNYVQPICLWPDEAAPLEDIIDKNGVVVGWGLNEREQLSDILTQAQMPVVGLAQCLETNRDVFGSLLTTTNYCAGFRNGTGVCNGDSGGGMFFKKDDKYHIRGLVSVTTTQANKNTCDPKEYVVFTDVGKYVKWIRDRLI